MRTAIMGALGLMVAVAGVQVSLVAGTGSAEAASSTFEAPVYAGDFPDPSFLLVGGVYWAYSTGSAGRNLQVMSSPTCGPGAPRWIRCRCYRPGPPQEARGRQG